MLNFSSIPRESMLGYILRLPFTCIPHSTVVRVVQGKLRGYRWIARSGPNGLWLGSYELPKQKRMMEFLQEGSVVYDIGANVGIYRLLSSECTGRTGHVHAAECIAWRAAIIGDCASCHFHGDEVHRSCCDLLRSFDYRIEGLGGESIDKTDELVCLPLAH